MGKAVGQVSGLGGAQQQQRGAAGLDVVTLLDALLRSEAGVDLATALVEQSAAAEEVDGGTKALVS